MPRFTLHKAKRSGGPQSKAFGLLRGKQKARIFVYPVGKRSFSFGARPRFPPPNFVFRLAKYAAKKSFVCLNSFYLVV
ncbi:MAG: hypothetical protein AUJ11_00320 [Parcubacteria group bacterium CG1_02_44_65]|nr:MAG: hypothetical protein AUJ11_00320 [Parcubacteria group bacterium CG1_02_44_65]